MSATPATLAGACAAQDGRPTPEDTLRRQSFQVLSPLQSGTEDVVRLDDALAALAVAWAHARETHARESHAWWRAARQSAAEVALLRATVKQSLTDDAHRPALYPTTTVVVHDARGWRDGA